jgi:hypothetical protein
LPDPDRIDLLLQLYIEKRDDYQRSSPVHGDSHWSGGPKRLGRFFVRKDGASPLLLFLKWFDIADQKLKGERPIYVKPHEKLASLQSYVATFKSQRPFVNKGKVNILFYEEVTPYRIERLVPTRTFSALELQDGDIICFMYQPTDAE